MRKGDQYRQIYFRICEKDRFYYRSRLSYKNGRTTGSGIRLWRNFPS